MSDKYFKMDLHIHTPASTDCYLGPNTEEEYLNILKTAKVKNIDIIAITDHNTISGYEKLMNIKNKLQVQIEGFNKITPNSEIEKEIVKLKNDYALFENIRILLGVEITLNPGVHIIVIAKDEAQNELKQLLELTGHKSDVKSSRDTIAKMDIYTFLALPNMDDKIIIAPHVDKDKGIYNVLSGSYRAHVFKSDALKALSCNDPEQLKNIKSRLLTKTEYRRSTSLAFINASDAHCLESIGNKVSYINISNNSFDQILNAFNNPEQTISDTNNPQALSIVKSVLDSGKAILLEQDEQQNLSKAICACLNNGYGHVLLGVSKQSHSIIGVKESKEVLTETLKNSISNITKDNVDFKMNIESLGNGRNIGIYTFRDVQTFSNYIFSLEDEVYIPDNKFYFKKASINEVEHIIKSNIINELKKLDIKNNTNIDNIILSLKGSKGTIEKYELERNIINSCVPISSIVDIKYFKEHIIEDLSPNIYNGEPDGNVYIPNKEEPRLQDAYLRCSCPCIECDDESKLTKLKKISGSAIIINEKGGCFLIEKDEWYLYPACDVLVLTSKDTNFPLHYLLGWLKSSLLLWLAKWRNNSVNIYKIQFFYSTYVPTIKNDKIEEEICLLVKEIIKKEFDFLTLYNNKFKENENANFEEQIRDINEHNKNVLIEAKIIDEVFNKQFNLSETQRDILIDDLRSNNIFCF